MNKALLLLGIIVLTQALQGTNLQQQHNKLLLISQASFKLEDIKSNHLTSAITKLLSLKSTVQQVDFSRLFSALDDLVDSIKVRQDEEKADLERCYQEFLSDSDFYGNQVTQFTAEAATHQVDLDDLISSRRELQFALGNKKNSANDAKRAKQDLESLIKKNENQYNSQIKQYDAAIAVLDQVLEQIKKLQASSFIQTNQEEFNNFNKILSVKLSQISHRKFFFEPIVDALVQLAQAKFSDQETVMKVIKLLNKLREELAASKRALMGVYQSERGQQDELLGQLTQSLALLSEDIIPKLSDDVETKNGQVETKTKLLKDATENLNTAQGSLDDTNNRWNERQVQNKKITDEYDNELVIIAQTVQTLEKGGVRRP